MPQKPTITSKRDAFQALGDMIIFYRMMESTDQDLIGMLDILDSNDPCICFFLESDHQEVLMNQEALDNTLYVRYQLDEELYDEEVSFRTIEMFISTVKENIQNELIEKPIFMN